MRHQPIIATVANPRQAQRQQPQNDHLFGFTGWHFIDIGSDLLRSILEPLNRTLQQLATAKPEHWTQIASKLSAIMPVAMRALPLLGVAGEAAHVHTPFNNARADFDAGVIGSEKFAFLCAIYSVYVASGAGGIFTSGAKEGLSQLVERMGVIEERYMPHTTYKELQHAGILSGGEHDHSHQHEGARAQGNHLRLYPWPQMAPALAHSHVDYHDEPTQPARTPPQHNHRHNHKK